MNLPIEICAIVEDYLPLHPNDEFMKDVFHTAKRLSPIRPRPRRQRPNYQLVLMSALGTTSFPVRNTWSQWGCFRTFLVDKTPHISQLSKAEFEDSNNRTSLNTFHVEFNVIGTNTNKYMKIQYI